MGKVIGALRLGYLWEQIKSYIAGKKYAGGTADGGTANRAASIPFGTVDSTSTATAFTATVDGITELRNGVSLYLKNDVVTSAAASTSPKCWTLNINNLGAKPVYVTTAAATYSTTHFTKNYKMLFTYDTSLNSGNGGWYIGQLFNSNTTYSDMTQAEITAGTGTTGRKITPKMLRDNFYTEDEVDNLIEAIAPGDENVIETVKVNGTALTPDANKAVDITVPTPYIMEISGSGSSVTIEEHAYETLSNAISEGRDVYLKKGSYLYALNVYGEDYLYFTHTSGEELFIESVVVYSDDTAESFLNFLRSAYIGGSDVALGAGDKLVITDASHNNYISRSPITFDGSTTTKALTPKGTWETFLQSYTETDPTVPAWAKAANKPSYTAAEVGALPDTTTIPAAPGTLNTTATTAQSTNSSEALSGNVTLHKIAKTGTYNDLIGKPTIPTVPTNVSAFTNDAGYTTNTGTITGITMNGASKGTSGVVDLGTVLTAHQDISGKVGSTTVHTIVSLTEAEYTALSTKDSSTLYIITS